MLKMTLGLGRTGYRAILFCDRNMNMTFPQNCFFFFLTKEAKVLKRDMFKHKQPHKNFV